MSEERAQLLDWARKEAERLQESAGKGGAQRKAYLVRAHGAAALDFLARHASGTQFASSAQALFEHSEGINQAEGLWALAKVLELWITYVESEMIDILPFEVGARLEAATDLMEQVQQLLDDNKVHPAAPMVLAGAALEEFLRSRIAALGVTVSGKPSISSYASALRTAGDLSAQDVKDITAWAGQRNKAAHGEFDDLSRAGAQLMVNGINLFIRQKTT